MAYTLDNLRTDIRNYTEVDNQAATDPSYVPKVLTDPVLETIIKNAENKIYREIDTDQNVFYSTSNAIVGNRYVTIPNDLRAIRYVQFKDKAGNQFYLEQRDTSFMAEYYSTPSTAAVDIPKYYANWDEEFWVVAPTPDKTYDITISYDKEPISITDTNNPIAAPAATNGTYLSNKYQDLLLYGCLINTFAYLKGPQDMLQYYQQVYRQAIESYAIEQIGIRRRDEYEDGEVRAQLNVKPPSS
jgi:hypothetical protein